MITPKERPILFSAPMVRAILDGRKTQTRRIINPQPYIDGMGNFCWNGRNFGQDSNGPCIQAIASPIPSSKTKRICCPYGKPGDLLYIKEAAWMWCEKKPNGTTKTGKQKWLYEPLREAPVVYCADHPDKPTLKIAHEETGNEWGWRKKIGRFLPRWASRTTLEIVSVRVERLQDISECDAKAEGSYVCDYFGRRLLDQSSNQGCYKWGYRSIWESINGSGSWNFNPFVWVVEFRTLETARAAA